MSSESTSNAGCCNIWNLPPLPESVEGHLSLLSNVAGIIGIDDVSFSGYATTIRRLFSSELSIKRSLNRLEYVENELRTHLSSAKHEERLVKKWTETIQSDRQAGESAVTLERRRDALLKKAEDYRRELDGLMANLPDPVVTITDLTAQRERIRVKEQDLKSKRAKIKAFQGLPPNLDLARHELRHAQNEQMKLVQLRERLLGKMADGVV